MNPHGDKHTSPSKAAITIDPKKYGAPAAKKEPRKGRRNLNLREEKDRTLIGRRRSMWKLELEAFRKKVLAGGILLDRYHTCPVN